MTSTTDIILSAIGFIVSLIGGINDDLVIVVLGILIIFLNIVVHIHSQEKDIKSLNDQINTSKEINRLWMEIERLKDGKGKK